MNIPDAKHREYFLLTFTMCNAIIFTERGVFMNIELRTATINDAEEILAIYSPYVGIV